MTLISGPSLGQLAARTPRWRQGWLGDGECRMRGGRLSNRLIDRLVIALLVVGFVAYASTRPTFRLRVDMPSEFLDAPASWPPERRAAEKKVARAYWYCVVTVIQPKYSFGDPLPLNPPAEFKIITPDLAEGATDPEHSARLLAQAPANLVSGQHLEERAKVEFPMVDGSGEVGRAAVAQLRGEVCWHLTAPRVACGKQVRGPFGVIGNATARQPERLFFRNFR